MNKTVLVIDDDKLARDSLSLALEDKGLTVILAGDGKEGLAMALDKHPDLVVTDIRMPEMDGQELLERLRQDEWGKNVPAIVMSSDDSTGSLNQALQAGVTVYMSKTTFTVDDIAQQVLVAVGS